jgi:hypothetical protein
MLWRFPGSRRFPPVGPVVGYHGWCRPRHMGSHACAYPGPRWTQLRLTERWHGWTTMPCWQRSNAMVHFSTTDDRRKSWTATACMHLINGVRGEASKGQASRAIVLNLHAPYGWEHHSTHVAFIFCSRLNLTPGTITTHEWSTALWQFVLPSLTNKVLRTSLVRFHLTYGFYSKGFLKETQY